MIQESVITMLRNRRSRWIGIRDHDGPEYAVKVTAVLDRLIPERGKPALITMDNGTEFTNKHFDAWAYHRQINIGPGKPIENCFIESFNGRLRDEYLNMHWSLVGNVPLGA